MRRKMTRGKCSICGGTFGKRAMAPHLKLCMENEAGSGKAGPGAGARKNKTFYLLVEGRYCRDYWMYVEAAADAQLATLDEFLRNIWLECCGHMSAFTIRGKTYSVAPMAEFDDLAMGVELSEVLTAGMCFEHEYDFGSTTHLTLKVVGAGEGRIKGRSVRVLAINEPPFIPCSSCGKPATRICGECAWSDKGWVCDECAQGHECGDDMFLPVVNSPRVGVCGYTG